MRHHQLYLSIHIIHFRSNACGFGYQNGLHNHSQLSCHAICLLLFSCMWLWNQMDYRHCNRNCHTQTSSTFLSVIHNQMVRWPLHSLPLVLYTSATLMPRVYFIQLHTGIFGLYFLLLVIIALADISTFVTSSWGWNHCWSTWYHLRLSSRSCCQFLSIRNLFRVRWLTQPHLYQYQTRCASFSHSITFGSSDLLNLTSCIAAFVPLASLSLLLLSPERWCPFSFRSLSPSCFEWRLLAHYIWSTRRHCACVQAQHLHCNRRRNYYRHLPLDPLQIHVL